MKTTSYEISKKLKEAGFKAETDFTWNTRTTYCGNTPKKVQYFIKYNNGLKEGEEICKSYDLETLLDALKQTGKRIMIVVKNDNWGINFDYEFNKYSQEKESLADTAGRLLILLHEKNLIKF